MEELKEEALNEIKSIAKGLTREELERMKQMLQRFEQKRQEREIISCSFDEPDETEKIEDIKI